MKSVIYFCNWAIYDRNHFVPDLPAANLTHVLYAFADIDPDTGTVKLSDSWADVEKHYDGDRWDEAGSNLYGNFKKLFRLKQQNRRLKVLLSIGGWTYSPHFAPMAADPNKRAVFVSSALKLLNDLGLDGLDIDWEFPKNLGEGEQYLQILHDLRVALDQNSRDILSLTGYQPKFYLTIAAPCGAENLANLLIPQMDQYLDFWNLMAYDFAGPAWATRTGHQANIYGDPISADSAINHYVQQGVPVQKIILGMPLYGRVFGNTDGLNMPFNGHGDRGSWEAGVLDNKALSTMATMDYTAIASYSYDPISRTLITYDTPECAALKGKYIVNKGLGGAMWWESSGDRPADAEDSIVNTVINAIGGRRQLDQEAENNLFYPNSGYVNIRENRAL
ncbi:chitinase [Myxozyma melibiosi]|uniref:chitinase n=1 Tax=Myxozyma melibiosi TaxID=54550 RepID=A0ABR1F323_9ASCO